MPQALKEIAVGTQVECDQCGETLVRTVESDQPVNDFIEVASGRQHECWKQLPDNAEHIRLD